ncbi:MAG: D-arabinono-1,4-lactone oxidase [Bacteroidota bacterium]|nr:D-arabinono-1,4-lactone oxidase [Bacteroidota bacterium]
MSNSQQNNWSNWSGSVQCAPKEIQKPASQEEIQTIIRNCVEQKSTIRMVGSGHSFTELVGTQGTIISLDLLQGLENIDTEKKVATVLAGTKLKSLGELLLSNDLAQKNLGDIDVQSIAGAASTGTHGTGVTLGSVSTQILEITLITAKGEIMVCSENQNKDIFKAAQVSLGTLGIITKIKLQLVPAYKLKYVKGKTSLDECLNNLEKYKNENRNFEFYWFPHTNIIQTKTLNITEEEPMKSSFMKYFNDMVLENGAFKVLSELCRLFPSLCKRVSKISAAAVSTGVDINYSTKIYATPRLVKFQEMEYNLPAEKAVEALNEMRECINAANFKVHFPIEVRFVKADDMYLSPAYQRDSVYIAVHMYKGMEYKTYFDAMETIFKKYNGRPHWGKMHTRTAKELSQLYPMWNKFQEVRNQLDPNGLFMNDYLKKLMVE